MDLNKIIQSLVQEIVRLEVSGKKLMNGTLIDVGSDVIVLFNGTNFVYIPLVHVHNFGVDLDNEDDLQAPTELPSLVAEESEEDLSFGEVLAQAKGRYVEIYVTGGQSLHGTVTGIMNNYIVFQSPVYKTMYISLNHLKWLIPYAQNHKLYGLANDATLTRLNNEKFAPTFEKQVEKLKNKIVVLNIGGGKSYIGIVNTVEEQIVEFQSARTSPVYLNLHHIKTLHEV